MSVPMNSRCYECHFGKNIRTARSLGDDATATAFAKELLALYLNAPADAGSPYLGPHTNALYKKYYGLGPDRYRQEKEDSNRFVLERMEQLRLRAEQESDPVLAGVKLSILGNFLDFHCLQGQVTFEKLEEMLESALQMQLDLDAYRQFCRDCSQGKSLLYITDNAGEIGFDRILAEQLQKQYPHLRITFLVRGGIAQNDATREDAQVVGIPFPVIDTGNDIAGTELSMLSREAADALQTADVILAKGMGNVETMYGCGYNVYYAFLVKCVRIAEFFHAPMMQPMFVRDRK